MVLVNRPWSVWSEVDIAVDGRSRIRSYLRGTTVTNDRTELTSDQTRA